MLDRWLRAQAFVGSYVVVLGLHWLYSLLTLHFIGN